MPTVLTIREDLRASIQARLDGLTDPAGAVCYAYPVEALGALPAVVILPDEPWWRPKHFGNNPSEAVAVNFEIQLMVTRTEVEEGLGDLEALAVAVGVAITDPGSVCRWVDLSQPEPVTVNDIPAILARMAVTATV